MIELRKKERELVEAIQFVQTQDCIDELLRHFYGKVVVLVEWNYGCCYHSLLDAIENGASPSTIKRIIVNGEYSRRAKQEAKPSDWIITNSDNEYFVLTDRALHRLYEEVI